MKDSGHLKDVPKYESFWSLFRHYLDNKGQISDDSNRKLLLPEE